MIRNWVESAGTLLYTIGPNGGHRLTVELDKDFGKYYYSLIPKYKNANRQKYNPHISVIRHETPPNLDVWGKYQGKRIVFQYDTIIRTCPVYYWLDVICKELEDIRSELGLFKPPMYPHLVPEGYDKLFHITIGNNK